MSQHDNLSHRNRTKSRDLLEKSVYIAIYGFILRFSVSARLVAIIFYGVNKGFAILFFLGVTDSVNGEELLAC